VARAGRGSWFASPSSARGTLRSTERRRIPALDGLRALAITLVLAHHAGFAKGGGIGVTVFFVLSGYLITGILLKPGALVPRRLATFYGRRFLRLFPAVAVVSAVCLAWALLVLDGHDRRFLLTEVLTSVTYTQDFYLGHGRSTDDFGYLGHTWSLAIEEQFYLVWPLLLSAVIALVASWRGRVAATLGLALIFTAWRAHLAGQGLNAHLALNIDAQGDSLLVGCALGIAMPHIKDRLPRMQPLLDAAAIATLLTLLTFSLAYANRATPGRTGYLLVALATAALIMRLLTPPRTAVGRLVTRAFELRAAVFLGVISYSVYLWHPVLLLMAKRDFGLTSRPQQIASAPVFLALILAVSWMSWRWVEQPFQRLKESRLPDTGPAPPAVPEPVVASEEPLSTRPGAGAGAGAGKA
jgi:peptidoglycan/LPS O-acetylase OafA/YrhL